MEERDSSQQGLDERDVDIRTGKRKGNPWKACSGADVEDSCSERDLSRDGSAVENVAVPESVDFPRPDEATLHSARGKHLHVALGQR